MYNESLVVDITKKDSKKIESKKEDDKNMKGGIVRGGTLSCLHIFKSSSWIFL
jgi:hypothetical protein